MRCCAGDEGFVALRSRSAEGGFRPPHAALAETVVVSDEEKAPTEASGGVCRAKTRTLL
jgi:hypothetical protein